jgi:2-polyprenyl-3-methyl-5-hydroxy-6-metoxy-1,4-benzoquinol methylase
MKYGVKSKYLWRSLGKHFSTARFECPNCGGKRAEIVDRKAFVTSLRRCLQCELLFRTPTTSETENAQYYQQEYDQGFTTQIPSESRLKELTATEFKGSDKDYSGYLMVLAALGLKPGQRILDFGCSWGYGAWQLQNAGYEVQAFEISKPRCNFARSTLGLNAVDDVKTLQGPFDCFFSAHVLEHVPRIGEVIGLAQRTVGIGGLFVAFTPNGSEINRRRNPVGWHRRWGLVHPQLLDEHFVQRNVVTEPYLLASNPVAIEHLTAWDQKSSIQLPLEGDELLIVFKRSN